MVNPNGWNVETCLAPATVRDGCEVALSIAIDISNAHRNALIADKVYDCNESVDDLRGLASTPTV
jgi:hypothetical protein